MARLESDPGRLLVSFQFNGARCREYLGLDDTRDNRRTGARTVNELAAHLRARSLLLELQDYWIEHIKRRAHSTFS